MRGEGRSERGRVDRGRRRGEGEEIGRVRKRVGGTEEGRRNVTMIQSLTDQAPSKTTHTYMHSVHVHIYARSITSKLVHSIQFLAYTLFITAPYMLK